MSISYTTLLYETIYEYFNNSFPFLLMQTLLRPMKDRKKYNFLRVCQILTTSIHSTLATIFVQRAKFPNIWITLTLNIATIGRLGIVGINFSTSDKWSIYEWWQIFEPSWFQFCHDPVHKKHTLLASLV